MYCSGKSQSPGYGEVYTKGGDDRIEMGSGEDHAVIEDQYGQLLMLSAVGDYGEVQGDGQLIGNGSGNYLYERVGGGSDELQGFGGRDSLIATGGNDRLFGGDDDDDLLEGGAGSDTRGTEESQSAQYGESGSSDSNRLVIGSCSELKMRRQHLIQRPIHFH